MRDVDAGRSERRRAHRRSGSQVWPAAARDRLARRVVLGGAAAAGGARSRAAVLLLLDDVHWAEPALLDLVEYLGARETDAPLLVLCLARPELDSAGWASMRSRLGPLDEGETRELVASTSRARGGGSRAASSSSPRATRSTSSSWPHTRQRESVGLPPTLDGACSPAASAAWTTTERTMLQRAAVVGREFSRGVVAALVPRELAVDGHLLAVAPQLHPLRRRPPAGRRRLPLPPRPAARRRLRDADEERARGAARTHQRRGSTATARRRRPCRLSPRAGCAATARDRLGRGRTGRRCGERLGEAGDACLAHERRGGRDSDCSARARQSPAPRLATSRAARGRERSLSASERRRVEEALSRAVLVDEKPGARRATDCGSRRRRARASTS